MHNSNVAFTSIESYKKYISKAWTCQIWRHISPRRRWKG